MPSVLALSPAERAAFILDRIEKSPEWAAALYILTSPTFARKTAVWSHVSEDGIRFKSMIEAVGRSSAKRVMLAAAWNLFNRGTRIDLTDLTSTLDDAAYYRVSYAMQLRREALAWRPQPEQIAALWAGSRRLG